MIVSPLSESSTFAVAWIHLVQIVINQFSDREVLILLELQTVGNIGEEGQGLKIDPCSEDRLDYESRDLNQASLTSSVQIPGNICRLDNYPS